MSNRINPYQNLLAHPYGQAASRSEVQAPAQAAAQPAQRARAAAQPAAAADGLSRAEQQVIARYFPASDAMALRVYGANRNAQTINPGAVGSRLDVSG